MGATVIVRITCDVVGCEQNNAVAVALGSLKEGAVLQSRPDADGWYESATNGATYCPLHKPKFLSFVKIEQLG